MGNATPLGRWVAFIATLIIVAVALAVARRVFGRRDRENTETDFRNKLVLLSLWLVAMVALLVAAPFEPTTRGQLLGLLGLMISAAIALSSTTILGNLMAGIMQRAVGNFRVGDFVRVKEYFGRVTERSLFHTEIQTEDRDLITLPNLYLVTHPVRVIRNSGTVVTADVSLGYEVSHAVIEPLLLAAAETAGLDDPFVQIRELGDFTVSYRTAGLLTEVKRLLTVRSRLREAILDQLHAAGVEIASPTLMSTRAYPPDHAILPRPVSRPAPPESGAEPEAVVFDKADEAETLEALRDRQSGLEEQITAAEQAVKEAADDAGRAVRQRDLDKLRREQEILAIAITRREEAKSEGSD